MLAVVGCTITVMTEGAVEGWLPDTPQPQASAAREKETAQIRSRLPHALPMLAWTRGVCLDGECWGWVSIFMRADVKAIDVPERRRELGGLCERRLAGRRQRRSER